MEVSRPDQSQEARPNAGHKGRDAHQFHSSEGIPLYSKQLEEEEELEIDTQVFTPLASTTTTKYCPLFINNNAKRIFKSLLLHPVQEKNKLLQRQKHP